MLVMYLPLYLYLISVLLLLTVAVQCLGLQSAVVAEGERRLVKEGTLHLVLDHTAVLQDLDFDPDHVL